MLNEMVDEFAAFHLNCRCIHTFETRHQSLHVYIVTFLATHLISGSYIQVGLYVDLIQTF